MKVFEVRGTTLTTSDFLNQDILDGQFSINYSYHKPGYLISLVALQSNSVYEKLPKMTSLELIWTF